jgi:hypothetical protein
MNDHLLQSLRYQEQELDKSAPPAAPVRRRKAARGSSS